MTEAWDLSSEPFERVLLKPKRGGVSVQLVALVWVPMPALPLRQAQGHPGRSRGMSDFRAAGGRA